MVAEVLVQTEDRSALGETFSHAARCISWAVDEGYMRCIISKGLALRRAQAQLAGSSLSDSIPDLDPNMRPPKGITTTRRPRCVMQLPPIGNLQECTWVGARLSCEARPEIKSRGSATCILRGQLAMQVCKSPGGGETAMVGIC